ncbi:uncharacterized protein ARMOST_15077 [Armillaria ostoyae]|uniref:Cytochrome P450 n=1 Tax=Armillaria ostoyae TaxID=47428 RepID=A0A284RSD5_ARMOS|nr:uncharacterized protein ARMOST_15077 [Armillaria ostoyae]
MASFVIAVASLLLASLLHRWFKRPSVKHVKGPPSPSFWLGHERVLRDQGNAGDLETKWRKEYGTVYRISGCLGQDILIVCDPQALKHIFHSSHPYPKSQDNMFILDLVVGKGLVTVDDETHHRQRKIMNPAFSLAQLQKAQVIFQQCSDKLVNGIQGSLARTGTDDTINVLDWTSKAALDIIGLASFRTASQSNPTALELILVALIRMVPDSALGFLKMFSTREIRQLASVGNIAKTTAREVMASHDEVQTPEGDGDIVDMLARARFAGKIQDDEIEAQLMTFVVAGHETTSISLSWLLYELAEHPEHQSIIRAELKQSNDYDSMPFLNAAIKESLRLHPNSHTFIRTAPHDDVLPLSGGEELVIPKGQTLFCSAHLYNRHAFPMLLQCEFNLTRTFSSLPSLWGDDADEWNLSRFFDKTLPVSLGVYANLMTFSTGPRSCIGWRFAVMEMQTILAKLILHFEFSLPEGVEVQQFPGSPGESFTSVNSVTSEVVKAESYV